MRLFISLFTFLLFTSQIAICQVNKKSTNKIRPWEDPEVSGINRMPARATSFSFSNEIEALNNVKENSGRYKLLNGDWKFYWTPTPKGIPTGFEKTSFNDSNWKTIPVQDRCITKLNQSYSFTTVHFEF